MRERAIRYTTAAIGDLREIKDYLVQHDPGAARNVGEAIERAVLLLSLFPHKSRNVRRRDWHALPLSRYPYIVFFRIRRDEIEILHIRHAARRHPGFTEDARPYRAA